MELSRNEFHAYLLLYSVQADQTVNEEEREFIFRQIPESTYKKVEKIINHENDYERIERILNHMQTHEYERPEEIIAEIKRGMQVDGEMDSAEMAVFIGLKRLLKSAAGSKE
jgi:hypothetical protein